MGSEVTAVNEERFFERIQSYLKAEECRTVCDALELARREHGDQRRKSGELFFTHPLTVAYYLAEYKLDYHVLVAALLHDIAEDTRVSIEDIRRLFGEEVATLVNAVTKFQEVSPEEGAHAEPYTKAQLTEATLHKLLEVTTNDVRAIIIKLFDRLHNLRTISAMRRESQLRTASETLSIYAPIANRLGMWELMNELGRLSLEVADPEAYRKISARLQALRHKHKPEFEKVQGQIISCLMESGLDVRDVLFARENIYTIYQQLQQNGRSINEIDSRLRIVVLVGDWGACYQAMGYLHQLWAPVPKTFADFVAVPRDNLYRSLHTTVIHSNGQHMRIRIRTPEMEKVSAIGILTRWLHQGTALWPADMERRVANFQGMLGSNIRVEPYDPDTGVQDVVQDVLRKQIHVYTPKGDVQELAEGATALDFAYAIHTGLGDQCSSASINGRRIPLNQSLKEGDQVHINKRDTARPMRAWLDEDLGYLVTNNARSHVRRWFRRLPLAQALLDGERILRTELAMLGKSNYAHDDVAKQLGLSDTEELYRQLGRAELLPTTLSTRLLENAWDETPARALDTVVYAPNGEKYVITNANGRQLSLCGACKPVPEDKIVGYVRQSSQVTVHQEECHLLLRHQDNGKWMKLAWGTATQRLARITRIQIDVHDRHGLLYEISHLMHREQINIPDIHTPEAARQGEVRMELDLEVTNPRQLVRILHQVRALVNVYRVRCLPDTTYDGNDLLRPSLYRPE